MPHHLNSHSLSFDGTNQINLNTIGMLVVLISLQFRLKASEFKQLWFG